jgi:hypothetical protein
MPGAPSLAWPGDLQAASLNKVDVLDMATFVVPVRRLDKSPGEIGYDRRWDFVPGNGGFPEHINITDLNAFVNAKPPMFGYERAFNGPSCTP